MRDPGVGLPCRGWRHGESSNSFTALGMHRGKAQSLPFQSTAVVCGKRLGDFLRRSRKENFRVSRCSQGYSLVLGDLGLTSCPGLIERVKGKEVTALAVLGKRAFPEEGSMWSAVISSLLYLPVALGETN